MRILSGFMALVLLGAVAFGIYAWHPALQALAAPAGPFDPAQVRRGETLASIGNCAGCHSVPGQPSYAGGVPVQTPFGTIFGSNLTPDPETGIGTWSEAAFRRAMREGLDRQGRHLYPAFPYDHFTLVSDADDAALYAYLMSRAPVHHTPPADTLPFPLNLRPLLAGWKLLFFRPGPLQHARDTDPAISHGADLVEGLGHCGACHTPRNALGAERRAVALSGGVAEGWNAYPINAASPAPIPWTVETLTSYLSTGWQASHGVARGPMAQVTASLAAVPAQDVKAMAAYLMAGMGAPARRTDGTSTAEARPAAVAGTQSVVPQGDASRQGAAIYAGACASCHDGGRPVPFGGLPLRMSSALHATSPGNIVLVTLQGLRGPPGRPGAMMPGFAGTIGDDQMVALLAYLRDAVAHEPAWRDLPATVRSARATAAAAGYAPAATDVRGTP